MPESYCLTIAFLHEPNIVLVEGARRRRRDLGPTTRRIRFLETDPAAARLFERDVVVAILAGLFTGTATAAELPGQAAKNCRIPSAAANAAVKTSGSPFIGVFDGKWEKVLPVSIIVYDVNGSRVKGYYGWNDYKPWKVRAGCREVKGAIKDGVLLFGGNEPMEFRPRGNGLTGTYYYAMGTKNQLIEKGTFTRKR